MKARIYHDPKQAALAEAVADILKVPLGKARIASFPDGERDIRLLDDITGLTAIILFSTGPPVDANTMSLAFLADAAKRNGAKSVIAAVPYLGYSRAEKISKGGAIGCRIVADLLQGAGVDFLVTLDLHSPAISGFFHIPVFEGSAVSLLAQAFKASSAARVVLAPDAGGIKRASIFARLLGLPLAIAIKERPDKEARLQEIWGDFEGQEVIIYDDLVSTGETIGNAAKALRERGAREIDVAAVHPVLADGASKLLEASGVRRFVTTDSLRVNPNELQVERFSIAPLLADLISRCP